LDLLGRGRNELLSVLRGGERMRPELIAATDAALRQAAVRRFLRTERGFHGRFYAALYQELDARGLLVGGRLLEMEYQKSSRHEMSQRPDIVFHVPAEEAGAGVDENNIAVWALKRRATSKDAVEDFRKLDEMFRGLNYPVGIFVNIDAQRHMAHLYQGQYGERIEAVAVWVEEAVMTAWASRASAEATELQQARVPCVDKEELAKACREVARVTLWQTPQPYTPADIIDTTQIENTLRGYQSEAEHQAMLITESGGDPNVVTRAVKYIAHEYAMPPVKDDVEWFRHTLDVLCQLIYPTAAPSEDGVLFMADVERSSQEYRRSFLSDRPDSGLT
jgi:hypothetical protein